MKKLVMLSLVVVWMLAFLPFARAEEQILSPEAKEAIDQIGRKIMDDGKTTRRAIGTKDNKTGKAITEAGKATGGAITEAGKQTAGAIDQQTKAVKQGLEGQTAAVKQLDKKQQASNLVLLCLLIAIAVVITGLFIALILKGRPKTVVVAFSIAGQKYKYTPVVRDGRYLSPRAATTGSSEGYQYPIDLRRAAMGQLKRDQELLNQEVAAGRLVVV